MSRSLVLNATYEPLSIVPARRALVLVLRQKAIAVEAGDVNWHSELLSVPVPTVIRLRNFVKVPYGRRVALNRRAVFVRDNFKCQYCSAPAENLDHVVPRSRGGQHTWENVVACCKRCNVRKSDRSLEEAGYVLKKSPAPPSRYGWLLMTLGAQPHPTWEQYLETAVSA